jgi:nucleotide-binding universal stress UspA family protein
LLIHVIDPLMPMPDGYVSPPNYARLREAARAYGRKRLGRLVGRAEKAGVHATAMLREGTPQAEIVRAARRPGVELIVIGTHGRTGLSRLLLGSVASRVVGLASCPVLTVSPNAHRKRS